MRRMKIVFLAVAFGWTATATPRYIGVVAAEGSFWVDSAGVSDHATVFEGSWVETTGSTARLQIGAAVRVLMDVNSRVQVYADHLLLEKGRGQLDSGSNYYVQARTLRIMLGSAESRGVVTMGDSVVEVASLNGEVRVTNADGLLVARVQTRRPVELRPEQGRDGSVVTGCVAKAGRAYTMRDEVSAVTVEVRGAELAAQTGKRVQVMGKMAPLDHAEASADEVLQATEVKVLESECNPSAAANGTGSGERVIPSLSGIGSVLSSSAGAIIVGVAVAAASVVAATAINSQLHHAPAISPGR
jgi:hypothetical protein